MHLTQSYPFVESQIAHLGYPMLPFVNLTAAFACNHLINPFRDLANGEKYGLIIKIRTPAYSVSDKSCIADGMDVNVGTSVAKAVDVVAAAVVVLGACGCNDVRFGILNISNGVAALRFGLFLSSCIADACDAKHSFFFDMHKTISNQSHWQHNISVKL